MFEHCLSTMCRSVEKGKGGGSATLPDSYLKTFMARAILAEVSIFKVILECVVKVSMNRRTALLLLMCAYVCCVVEGK